MEGLDLMKSKVGRVVLYYQTQFAFWGHNVEENLARHCACHLSLGKASVLL